MGDKMKEKLNEYRWLVNSVLAGLLLILSLTLPFFNPERLIVTLTSLILIGFAGYRIYTLIRNPKWDNLLIKRINLVEMIVHAVLGVFFLLWIWAFDESLGLLLGYLLGGVLIARGGVYFYSDRNKETNDDFVVFALHIGAIVGGSYIVFQGDFTAEVLLGFIVAMALRRSIKYGMLAYNEIREKQKLSETEDTNDEETPTIQDDEKVESDLEKQTQQVE